MKLYFLFSSFCFLATAGAVALARWLHPATFSPHMLTLLLAGFVAAAAFHLWNHE